jgi:hypothetical protein
MPRGHTIPLGLGKDERDGMRWFRSHISIGSRLALVAMALQLVLTFGHVHADGLMRTSAAQSVLADRTTPASPSAPNPSSKGNGSADIDCPICALIQLASTSTPSVAPALPVPVNFVVIRLEAPAPLPWVASSYFSFQARAPPSI